MKVKFKNGVVKDCAAPTEQKIFRNVGGGLAATGWLLQLKLQGNTTSTELDELLVDENVTTLEFLGGEDKILFTLEGYSKITSSVIRHSDETSATYTEIQMTKEV